MGQFVNPLGTLSTAILKGMEQEVEDILSSDDSLSESFEDEVKTEEIEKNDNPVTTKSSTKRSYPSNASHHGDETSSKRSCSYFSNEKSEEELGSLVQNVSTDSDEQYTL